MEALKPLSNLQIEILQTFQFDLSDDQLQEIRTMLANYFAQKATEEMDRLFEENSWGQEKISEWAGEHLRTKYKAQ